MSIEEKPEYILYFSDFSLFEVRFSMFADANSASPSYTGIVFIVGKNNASEDELYKTAEDVARRYGAFRDAEESMYIDHKLYMRRFEPLSINKISEVHGISKSDADELANVVLDGGWD